MTDPDHLKQIRRRVPRLLQWFERHRRAMPWRNRRTPYRVWIAEIMLQQTRVDQVRPYYQRFMKRFPSLRRLAAAPVDDVLKAWEGLGYYSRARNLHRAARQIAAEHGGRFPRTAEELRRLPGVGAYTAAAIGSIAFNLPLAVVDGNVIRVLTRLTACAEDPRAGATRRALQELADRLLPRKTPGPFNEAVMELGATVCLPRRPQCAECPLRTACRGYAKGDPTAFPVKALRRKLPHKQVGAAAVINRRGQVLIAQRRPEAMLGGLWEFPGGSREPGETMPECVARELKEELGLQIEVGRPLITVRHAYSHFTIELHTFFARIRAGRPRRLECADYRWVYPEEFEQFAFSKADLAVVDALQRIARESNGLPRD
jgi:A/G-specific adenine glycosylase